MGAYSVMKLPADSGPLLFTYLALMGLSILIFVLARGFPFAHMGAAGPGFFPQVVAVLLCLLSLAGIAELWRNPARRARVPVRVLAVMALTLGYIGAMHYIGYYPSTFLFAALAMWSARDGAGVLRVLAEAALLVVVSFVFFELLIDAYLPTGVLFR